MRVTQMNEVIPEADLRELSRTLSSLFPKQAAHLTDQNFQILKSSFHRVLHTAGSAKLSVSHGTAAWNCIHGFLDQGIGSSVPQIRNLLLAPSICVIVFDTLLVTASTHKTKPMKQVIITLAKVISQIPDETKRATLVHHVIAAAVSMIHRSSGSFSVKLLFHALDHFIDKGIIDAPHLVWQYAVQNLPRSGECTLFTRPQSPEQDNSMELAKVLEVSQVEDLISDILDWARYPDTSSIAGGLLVTLCKSLRNYPHLKWSTDCSAPRPSLWAGPVTKALQKEPFLLEIFGLAILPGLLRVDHCDTKTFLNALPLKELQQGKALGISAVDIGVSLLTLKECMKSRLITAHGAPVSYPRPNDYNALDIAKGLVMHHSPFIRIAALGIVIDSTSFPTVPSSPFPIETLQLLQQVLPHFHTETNAKVRNEYFVLIKSLFAHVRRGLVHGFTEKLSREVHANENIIVNLDKSQVSSIQGRESQVLLQKNATLLKWFDEFLINELHPSTSYQHHITALKAMSSIDSASRFKSGVINILGSNKTGSESHNSAHDCFLGFQLIRLLLDLIMDPFDDVRSAAASLLRNLLSNVDSTNSDFNLNISVQAKNNEDETAINASSPIRLNDEKTFISTVDRAKNMMSRTGRADHADGFGRLCCLKFDFYNVINTSVGTDDRISVLNSLLSSLSEDITKLQNNFNLAIGSSPLHGNLIALRYLPREFFAALAITDCEDRESVFHREQLTSRILENCSEIWEVVKQYLCVDSPEGFEMDNVEDEDSGMGPKDTLSFAWRALKESSLLSAALILSGACPPSSSVQFSQFDGVQRIGDLAFIQLAELRHRGAFSTVAQTFATCCVAVAKGSFQKGNETIAPRTGSSLSAYLEKCYRDALLIIEKNAGALTRRSAGIPAIIVGILGADPEAQIVNKLILELQAIASSIQHINYVSDKSRLPQVHALNCLKDVFTNTSLATVTEPHMAKTLELAAGCLQADIWAIRNCGLMLFRALLNRMHGGSDTASTRISSNNRRFSKLVYEKYPNLPRLILGLLSPGQKNIAYTNGHQSSQLFAHSLEAQRVLPALEIIERSGLPSNHIAEIQYSLRKHMQSPVWTIREKSAKTLAAVVRDGDLAAEIKDLLKIGRSRQNVLHGSLLCIRCMIARLGVFSIDQQRSLLPQFIAAYEDLVMNNPCPLTAAAYIDIIADLFESLIRTDEILAEDFISKLEGRLWNQGKDGSLYPLLDITSMDASGALLRDAVERSLHLVRQMMISVSSRDNDSSNPIDGLVYKLKQIPSNMRSDRAKREAGSCLVAQIPNYSSTNCLSKDENAVLVASDPNNHTAPRAGSHRVVLGPQQFDDDLRSSGEAVALAYMENMKRLTNCETISEWICRVSLAADEGSELSTRQAAVGSIDAFLKMLRSHGFHGWKSNDDEDVRDEAAAVASTFLSTSTNLADIPNISLMPPAASWSLLQYFKTELNGSAVLFAEAAYRLTSSRSLFKRGPIQIAAPNLDDVQTKDSLEKALNIGGLFASIRPVREMMQEVRRQDNALFAEEKQNLFIDLVREAENWVAILMTATQLEKVVLIISAINDWTMRGLEVLIETADEEDGPLGWSTKPDVFTLGMRIILAAKVQVHWLQAGWNKEASLEHILILLNTLLDVGTKKLLNGIWLRQIEDILLRETV